MEALCEVKMAAAIRDYSAVHTFVDMVREGTVLDILPAAGTPDSLVTNVPLQFI
jgi:hypothetical protein